MTARPVGWIQAMALAIFLRSLAGPVSAGAPSELDPAPAMPEPDSGRAPAVAADEGRRPADLLFRGRPLPACRSFLITEFGLNRALAGRPRDAKLWCVTGELGIMSNVSPHDALGGTLLVEFDDNGNRVGLKARYRRWLAGSGGQARQMSVEVSGGLFFDGSDRYVDFDEACADGWNGRCWRERMIQYPSPVAAVQFNLADWISVANQVEWIRLDRGESTWAAYAGIRLGSYAGVVGGLGAAAATAIALAAWSASGGMF